MSSQAERVSWPEILLTCNFSRSMGAEGLARFLRLERSGPGDYTKDRMQWQIDAMSADRIVRSERQSGTHR
jgi:hypothetical protein